jgi:hypothetical protein
VRKIVVNPMTYFYGDAEGGAIIRDALTQNVADLYNVAYDTMLLMLLRFFTHNDETVELEVLSRGKISMMAWALRPLGEALTKIPAGEPYPGLGVGPRFGHNRDVHLSPHKNSAWTFFAEQLGQLATKRHRSARTSPYRRKSRKWRQRFWISPRRSAHSQRMEMPDRSQQ